MFVLLPYSDCVTPIFVFLLLHIIYLHCFCYIHYLLVKGIFSDQLINQIKQLILSASSCAIRSVRLVLPAFCGKTPAAALDRIHLNFRCKIYRSYLNLKFNKCPINAYKSLLNSPDEALYFTGVEENDVFLIMCFVPIRIHISIN